MAKDLRSYLKQLSSARPDDLKVVEKEVDPVLGVTAYVERLKRDGNGFPTLMFTNVKGSEIPALINFGGSVERLALSIDCDSARSAVPEYAKRLSNPVPTVVVEESEAPVKEVILSGDEVDLYKLPILKHNELDGGRYIDAGMAIVRDPDSGSLNAGIYRHQLFAKDELGFMSNPWHDASYILRRYREMGKPMEVAIAIGHHPGMFMAATSRVEGIGGEFEVAGALMGEPLEVVRAETVDIMVPARSEIVIEGVVDTSPDAMRDEGPFGEYPRYYTGIGPMPWVKVNTITMREKPIYHSVFNAHTEHLCLAALPFMADMYRRMRSIVPTVTMVNLPISGLGTTHAYISLKKARDGEPKQVAFAAFTANPLLKHVFVVDDDVDVFNEEDVLSCMCTSFQGDRDLTIIPYAPGGHLIPCTYDIDRDERGPDRHKKVMETKLIFDLTRPAPPTFFPPHTGVPEELVEAVDLETVQDFRGLPTDGG